MFASRFLPCAECGASVDRTDSQPHQCDEQRLLDYKMFALRHEIAWFERLLTSYLDTSAGRFDTWVAARKVHGG